MITASDLETLTTRLLFVIQRKTLESSELAKFCKLEIDLAVIRSAVSSAKSLGIVCKHNGRSLM